MKMSILLILFFITNAISQQLTLKEIATSVEAADLPYLAIDGMAIYGNSVYVVDRVMNRVAVLDKTNLHYQVDYSHSTNREASLLLPGFVAITSQYIYVADFAKNTIRVFSHSFEFVKLIHVYGAIFGIATDSHDGVWVASATYDKNQTIKKIDSSGNNVGEIHLKNAIGNPFDILYSFCIDVNDYFYIAYYDKNCVEVQHPSKGFIREFMVPGLPLNVKWSKLKGKLFSKDLPIPDGEIFTSISTDNNGNLFLLTGDYSETPSREIDICSTYGKFIGWCILNENSHLIRMVDKDHFISVEGKKNKVKIYEINHHPK